MSFHGLSGLPVQATMEDGVCLHLHARHVEPVLYAAPPTALLHSCLNAGHQQTSQLQIWDRKAGGLCQTV